MSAPEPTLAGVLAEMAEHVRALQDENAERESNGDYHCVFSSEDDARIPDGADCGGCACHLSAPCDHHLGHLPPEDAAELALALDVSGRWTR